jgi:transcriptional regulator with XRE-family HTH domain
MARFIPISGRKIHDKMLTIPVSPRELARRSGLSVGWVNEIIYSESKNVLPDTAKWLAHALKTSVDELRVEE